jgi:hypothetical protein
VREAPAAATNWTLDLETLIEGVVEQLRDRDSIPLRRLIVSISRELADAARGERAIDRTAELLDRVAALLAETLVIGRDDVFCDILHRLAASYEGALAAAHPASAVPAPLLGVMQLERAYAVGALAVRLRRFEAVKALATERIRSQFGPSPFWLLHAHRLAQRNDFFKTYAPHLTGVVSPISLGAETAKRNRFVVPDVLAEDDVVVTSLCEFDFLVAVAVIGLKEKIAPRLIPTGFARWFSARTDAIAADLVTPGSSAREVLFPGTDPELAGALRTIAELGNSDWPAAWDGYEDPTVLRFLHENCSG